MAEQFTLFTQIGNWPFYWPVIALGVLIGIALFLCEIIDRFLAQRRAELSHRLEWDAGYIERISKAFKNEETAKAQKKQTNGDSEDSFVKHRKPERMEVL